MTKNKAYLNLIKNLKGKDVIIYGAGKFFIEIAKSYDLSEINVIGIVDKKFLIEDEGKKIMGFPIIPYVKFSPYNTKATILITLEYPMEVIDELKSIGAKKIYSFVKISPLDRIYKKYFKPKKNTFILVKLNGKKVYNPRIKNLKVVFNGENNYVEIHEPFSVRDNVYLSCGSNSTVIIGQLNCYKSAEIILGTNNKLIIGKHTTMHTNNQILLRSASNTTLRIGDDCQFSWDVTVRTQDAHSVYDSKTKQLLNVPKDVTIGNHVWIGAHSTVLKGVEIPSNCMIGTHSLVVNKKFTEENCIIAGNPAKVIKTGINWDRRGACRYTYDDTL